ncbi:MAG: SusD/RagB family nutrient-binding outer membrane lipoprotein [Bacteroidales bacterium]|nr:SusD/RagB family nutrient-binding outer membrane lipoprotein [Bacteroidales bacterium]
MKKSILFILFAMLFWGCEDFLDVNESLDNDERTTPNFMLPSVLGNMSYAHYTQAETSSYITQYVTTEFGTNAVKDRWDYRGILRLGAWRRHYFDVAGNAHKMIDFAREEGSQNYVGVGKIIMAYSFLTATDVFGDMPILQAFTGIYNPTYDAQDVVYAEIERYLEEGMDALRKASVTDRAMTSSEDHVYQGDVSKWLSFAYAIQARMKLHTANFLGGYDEVLALIDQARPNWAEPYYAYITDADSDWYRNLWGPSRPSPQWDFAEIRNILNNSIHTNFFMHAMTLSGEHDPRLYALTTPGKNGNYFSVPASQGRGALDIDDFAILYNGYWTSDDSPIVWIMDEELYFMEAEAAYYLQDKTRAYNAYINGITRNFQRLGVAGELSDYLSSAAVVQNAEALHISDIMMQKYIALYLQPETWVDMRRYRYSQVAYPELTYPENALDLYEGRWIKRLPYDPQTEYIYNPNEIARLGARGDLWVVTPFWWIENSTLSNQ